MVVVGVEVEAVVGEVDEEAAAEGEEEGLVVEEVLAEEEEVAVEEDLEEEEDLEAEEEALEAEEDDLSCQMIVLL